MTSKRNFPPSSPLVGCSVTLFPGKGMAPCGEETTHRPKHSALNYWISHCLCCCSSITILTDDHEKNMLFKKGRVCQRTWQNDIYERLCELLCVCLFPLGVVGCYETRQHGRGSKARDSLLKIADSSVFLRKEDTNVVHLSQIWPVMTLDVRYPPLTPPVSRLFYHMKKKQQRWQ